MDPIEHGDIPASYVSLPEGTPHVLRRYLLHFSFLWVVFFFFPINVGFNMPALEAFGI